MKDVPVETGAGWYKCLECEEKNKKEIRYVNYKEATRAGRPRCLGCGSTRMEILPKKDDKKSE